MKHIAVNMQMCERPIEINWEVRMLQLKSTMRIRPQKNFSERENDSETDGFD
jgi:hypothetical protein